MKSILIRISTYSIGICALSTSALAASVTIPGHLCVPQKVPSVFGKVLDYEAYAKSPGALLTLKDMLNQTDDAMKAAKPTLNAIETVLTDLGKSPETFHFLNMLESVPTIRGVDSSNSDIAVKMRPSNIEDESIYPRFTMNCVSPARADTPNTTTSITHRCDLVKGTTHYAIDGFTSDLKVNARAADSPTCPGQTEINYTINIDSNDDELKTIRNAVVKKFGPLAMILDKTVGKLFDDPTAFFRAYYTNFYQGWVKTL